METIQADSDTATVDRPAKAAGGSRPTRVRRGQAKNEDAADGDDEGPSGEVAVEQAPPRKASPPPPKKRGGRIKKVRSLDRPSCSVISTPLTQGSCPRPETDYASSTRGREL